MSSYEQKELTIDEAKARHAKGKGVEYFAKNNQHPSTDWCKVTGDFFFSVTYAYRKYKK